MTRKPDNGEAPVVDVTGPRPPEPYRYLAECQPGDRVETRMAKIRFEVLEVGRGTCLVREIGKREETFRNRYYDKEGNVHEDEETFSVGYTGPRHAAPATEVRALDSEDESE